MISLLDTSVLVGVETGRLDGADLRDRDSLIGATARVHGMPLLTRDAGLAGMLGVDVRVV